MEVRFEKLDLSTHVWLFLFVSFTLRLKQPFCRRDSTQVATVSSHDIRIYGSAIDLKFCSSVKTRALLRPDFRYCLSHWSALKSVSRWQRLSQSISHHCSNLLFTFVTYHRVFIWVLCAWERGVGGGERRTW